jgi:hypothetical protein
MKHLAALLLAFLLLPTAALAQATPVRIGDTEITLPALDGYRELYGTNPTFDRAVEQFVPPDNRLLAVYVSDADIAAMNADAGAGMKKYLMVQTPKKPVKIAGPEQFNTFKEDIANQIGSGAWEEDKGVKETFAHVSEYMRSEHQVETELQVGETRFLGKFIDAPDAFGVLMLANYGVTTAAGAQNYPVVAGMSAVNVQGRVLLLFGYSDHQGEADINYVMRTTRGYIDELFALNGGVPLPAAAGTVVTEVAYPPQPKAEGDLGGAMSWATKAALVVLLLVAVVLLGPRLLAALRRKDDAV